MIPAYVEARMKRFNLLIKTKITNMKKQEKMKTMKIDGQNEK